MKLKMNRYRCSLKGVVDPKDTFVDLTDTPALIRDMASVKDEVLLKQEEPMSTETGEKVEKNKSILVRQNKVFRKQMKSLRKEMAQLRTQVGLHFLRSIFCVFLFFRLKTIYCSCINVVMSANCIPFGNLRT